MLRTYLEVFDEAVNRYVNQGQRPGYQPTVFTHFRHQAEKYQAIIDFENELKAASPESHKAIIKKWLANPKLKSNQHSFRTYLIDALIESKLDDEWLAYDDKKLVFYRIDETQYLYRGSLQSYEDAFEHGMTHGSGSLDIEDYASFVNYSAGVSTSKSPKVAHGYTSQLKMNQFGVNEFFGFLYQIHYRGNDAIDIDATHRARLGFFPTKGTKQEVNILSHIPREDIVGYGYLDSKTGAYVEMKRNPYYDAQKQPAPALEKKEVLQQTFGERDGSCTLL